MNSPGFGERLRKLFGKAKNAQIARNIDVSPAAVGNYINENRLPDLEVIIRIYEATECSLNWLIFGEGPEKAGNFQELSIEDLLSQMLANVDKLPDTEKHIILLRIINEITQLPFVEDDSAEQPDYNISHPNPTISGTKRTLVRKFHGHNHEGKNERKEQSS